jgi:purine catabolism regulator
MDHVSLDLNNFLRITFSSRIEWISEEPAVEISVNWVALSGKEIQQGDVLLVSASRMGQDVVDAAVQRGAAALLILGHLKEKTYRLPENLPVAVILEATGLHAAQKRLLAGMLAQRGALMEKGLRINTQLSQLVAEGEGLDGVARSIAEISGHGVLIQDKRLRILADCSSALLSMVWDDVLQQVVSLEFLPDVIQDRKEAGRKAPILTQKIPGNLVRLVTPVVVGEVARGYLSLIGQEGELDELDRLVIRQGAVVCAVEMARAKAVREVEKRLQGDLLDALLQENLSPRDAGLWMQTMAMEENIAHVALRFAWDGSSPPSRRRMETIINGEIARQKLKVINNPMAGEVVCFCQVPSGSARPEVAMQLGQAVLQQGAQEYPETPIRCGIGTPAMDFYDWRTSFRQAGQALELARRLRGLKPFYFPDLSVYRLLLQLEHSPELITFQEQTLGPLLAHENANELIATLEAYFYHNSNVSQTAESLFIHRNTLIYRLERISSIMNLNMDNPETRLAVQLALRIYRMMGAKSN